MQPIPRHQCLIYDGAPSRLLPAVAAITRQRLEENYRCLYLNSPPMVAGMRSYLAAAGVDVTEEMARTNLVLTSEQGHLTDGRFDVDRMIVTLEDALDQALSDGYTGLWATGDMTWEIGPRKDFSKLLDYEWRLESFFHEHPQLSGICQYHCGTLPREAMRQGLLAHTSIFVNETLSLVNPLYLYPEAFPSLAVRESELDAAVDDYCRRMDASSLF